MLKPPYSKIDALLNMIRAAGRRLDEIEASEGAVGNISVCLRWPIEVRAHFPLLDGIELLQPVPELANATFIVSSSERRLHEILDEPTADLVCILVREDDRTGTMYTSHKRRFERVTTLLRKDGIFSLYLVVTDHEKPLYMGGSRSDFAL